MGKDIFGARLGHSGDPYTFVPLNMASVSCLGNESRLIDCVYSMEVWNCWDTNAQDVGIWCETLNGEDLGMLLRTRLSYVGERLRPPI